MPEKEFGDKIKKKLNKSPLPFWGVEGESAMGITDKDVIEAQAEIAKFMFNFPSERIWSWSRWKPREIPLIAAILTKAIATNPNRPRNPDGSIKRLSQVKLEITGWLRLAENGAQRDEAKFGLRSDTETQQTGADAWKGE